jgi:hypothetical protein
LEVKHGAKSRRKWRKLYLTVEAGSGMIVARILTDQDGDNPSQAAPLLDQIARSEELVRRAAVSITA